MAPGPPTERAVATPAMFPMPTVLARAVAVAWKGVILFVLVRSAFLKTVARVLFHINRNFLIWKNRDFRVKNRATAAMNTMVQGPQRILSMEDAISRIVSIILVFLTLVFYFLLEQTIRDEHEFSICLCL